MPLTCSTSQSAPFGKSTWQVRVRRCVLAVLALLSLHAGLSHAWWNEQWALRKKVTLERSFAGSGADATLEELPVLVRLHTGNFQFLDANENGSDLRFVAADDKTVLAHHIEQWDATTELALIWVRIPRAVDASPYFWIYFGNQKAAPLDDRAQRYGAAQTLVLHLNTPQPTDASVYGQSITEYAQASPTQGPIDGAMHFNGKGRLRVAASPSLKADPRTGLTVSAWVRVEGPQGHAIVFRQPQGADSIELAVVGLRLTARAGSALLQGSTELTPNVWHHVAATWGSDGMSVYVDGTTDGHASALMPSVTGEAVIAEGLAGDIDEVQVASASRSAGWVHAAWASERAEASMLQYGAEEQIGGGHSYFRILLGAVTPDGWVVIGILILMLVISLLTMVGKALMVARTETANRIFMELFRKDPASMLDVQRAGEVMQTRGGMRSLERSSLFRMYRTGLRELALRFDQYDKAGRPRVLSPQSLNAIKASLDAGMVREAALLNAKMVLLTLAISGGPFLGLLGTVVGVMITFAAIAAAGDVNINSIAPGIAAALVATVAGLAVAIPSLFGYNYLASRIRAIVDEMTVFSDELVTRLAEEHAP